jgi:hypothetical protein
VPDKPSLEQTLLKEQLDYYRLQRHDFLNHWQVIMGYLQLGKADRALNYMRNGINDLEAEQQIGQIPQGIVAAILMSFVITLRKEAILVDVELDNRVKEANFWEEFYQEEYGQALYGYTRKCLIDLLKWRNGLEEPLVLLQFEGTNDFTCTIRLSDGDQIVWESQFELQR